MPNLKIAVIGAGSFVFGSSVLHEAALKHRLEDVELALVDVDREVLELMAGVGRRMAREAGTNALITTETEYAPALDGAAFVICSAARELYHRFAVDCALIEEHAPGHLISEFGGVAGISYSLRQIALITEITDEMKRRCPDAWLLNAANPLPRVAQAAHENGVRTVGFCSAALGGLGAAWRLLTGEAVRYPFAAPRERWDATMAGLNHFSWLLDLRDRATGEDLLPALRARLAEGATAGSPRVEALALETGYLLMTGDEHSKDFLPPVPGAHSRRTASHGTPEERRRRLDLLRDIGEGRAPYDELLRHEAWEKPVDLIAAMALGRPAHFEALNLVNDGRIPELPAGVFVETPAEGSKGGPVPRPVVLPGPVLPYCRQAALVTDTIVRAARQRSRALVNEAAEMDPTLVDKRAGRAAIDACLRAHADVLPRYE